MDFESAKAFISGKLQKELPDHLTYHSIGHIKDVYEAAGRLAEMEGITGEDLTLLLTAVLFHDAGFLEGQKDHEKTSCDIAREYLPSYGYTPAQIARIEGMIMATQLPQTPHNQLEQIICDADLDYLGRDDFWKIGNKLFSELQLYGMLQNEEQWNRLQISFLEKHHYFTESAIKLRKEKKDGYLNIIKSNITQSSI